LWPPIHLNIEGKTRSQEPPREVIEYSGSEQIPPETDLALFFGGATTIFVGVFEGYTQEFLTSGNLGTSELFSRLTFLPVEVLKAGVMSGKRFDIWDKGGRYIKTPTGPVPTAPSSFVAQFVPGHRYFLGTTTIVGSAILRDRPVFAARSAVIEIDGPRVNTMGTASAWRDAIVAQGRAAGVRATAPDSEAFLKAVRSAARTR